MTTLSTVQLSSVEKSEVRWLWPGRFPRGKVTMVCGDPGLGKSFLTMDMAARVTTAGDWPDSETPLRSPGTVLVLSAEDDAADTIRPRIEAAGGDPSRVVVCEGVLRPGPGGRSRLAGLCLDADVDAIARQVGAMERPRLVIIDPVSAYMGEADSHNNAQVRGVLGELSRLAMRLGPAVVCITHMNKRAGEKAVYRAMGSLAFMAAARMAWQVAPLPSDPDARALVLLKSNLDCVRTGLVYRLKNGRVEWDTGSIALTAESLETPEAVEQAEALPEAVAFLRSYFTGGARDAREVLQAAEEAGFSAATIKRAKKAAGVTARRAETGGSHRPWVWELARPYGPQDPLFAGGGKEGDGVGGAGEGEGTSAGAS